MIGFLILLLCSDIAEGWDFDQQTFVPGWDSDQQTFMPRWDSDRHTFKWKGFLSTHARNKKFDTKTDSPYQGGDLFKMVNKKGVNSANSGLLLYRGGTVCATGFNNNAAKAICSHMGYEGSWTIYSTGRSWGISYKYNITLGDVKCRASSWSRCTYNTNPTGCTHASDIYLTCPPGKLAVDGGWSDYGDWSECSGHSCEMTKTRECNNPTPSGGGADCQGESTLRVFCRKKDCTEDKFKLVDGSGSKNDSSGLLLYYGGTVCGHVFDQNAADAVCSELGFEARGSNWTSGVQWQTLQRQYDVTLDDVSCSNSSWSSCTYKRSASCYPLKNVFLSCAGRKGGPLSVTVIVCTTLAVVFLSCTVIVCSVAWFRKYKGEQSQQSQDRPNQAMELGDYVSITTTPVEPNDEEIPENEPEPSAPALGTDNVCPPPYSKAVNENEEDEVPTYEEVMAAENKYMTH